MSTNVKVVNGQIGIDLNIVGSARSYGLGDSYMTDGGGEFMYVRYESAVNIGGMCKIEAGFLASAGTGPAWASADTRLGFAQTTHPASTYGFLALAGQNVLVRTLGGATGGGGQALYTTDTAGALSTATASSSQFQVWGVWLQSSVSASAATATVSTAAVSYPHLRRPLSRA